jgi:hypothetical protein
MKKFLKINRGFFKKYFRKSSICIFSESEHKTFETLLWGFELSVYANKYDLKEKDVIPNSFFWAKEFCESNKINKNCIPDFALIFEMIRMSKFEYEEIIQCRKDMNCMALFDKIMYKAYINSGDNFINGITIHLKGKESITIKNVDSLNAIVEGYVYPGGVGHVYKDYEDLK